MKKNNYPTIAKTTINPILIFSSLLSLIFLVPALIHNQAITGPIVNAILLIASQLVGPGLAMLIGMLPSTVALSRGLLPLALAPMVPFIILSNSLYVYLFSQIKGQAKSGFKFAVATLSASLAKFTLLYSSSQLILTRLLPNKLVPKVSQMMSWPQLATALVGGLIAWFVLRAIDQDFINYSEKSE